MIYSVVNFCCMAKWLHLYMYVYTYILFSIMVYGRYWIWFPVYSSRLLLFSCQVMSDSAALGLSSVHGDSYASMLGWVAISFSRDLSGSQMECVSLAPGRRVLCHSHQESPWPCCLPALYIVSASAGPNLPRHPSPAPLPPGRPQYAFMSVNLFLSHKYVCVVF